MQFENDIFISYAHIDNQALAEGGTGWIANFHRALEIRLAQLLGRLPRIWRDPKLQGNDYFADKLVERLPKVALLVSILSPRYLNSEWCIRELVEFTKASERNGGSRIGDKARVFKVIKTPIPFDAQPTDLQQMLGYEFFSRDPETGRARELSQKAEAETERLYWARLDDLAHDLAELLPIVEHAAPPAALSTAPTDTPVAPTRPESECIYLAETSFDIKEEHDAVKRELLAHNYTVLPDRPLPLVAAECEAFVRQALAACKLSIHMVGKNYGVVPDGSPESLVLLQHEVAIEQGHSQGLPRLIWMPPELAADDPRQVSFIESLEVDPNIQAGTDLFKAPLEDFKTAIHQRLNPPKEPSRRTTQEEDADDLITIYLIHDQRDLDGTVPLEDYLFDQGFEVIGSIFDGDETQVRLDHEESMLNCDAALVYYGQGNELWLRRKMRELQRSAGLGRRTPLRAKSIYIAPPENPRKSRFRTHEALVIEQAGDFSPKSLDPFLNQLH